MASAWRGCFTDGMPDSQVEDHLNWHGKPLGAAAEKTLEHLKSLIVNKGKTMLVPQKPLKEDAPDVDIVNVKLNEPPSYKLGEWGRDTTH